MPPRWILDATPELIRTIEAEHDDAWFIPEFLCDDVATDDRVFCCSECGAYVRDNTVMRSYGARGKDIWHEESDLYKIRFCPNCGAKVVHDE